MKQEDATVTTVATLVLKNATVQTMTVAGQQEISSAYAGDFDTADLLKVNYKNWKRGQRVKIISGFCSGADIGGIKAAHDMGFPTGGWVWYGDCERNPEWAEKYGAIDVPKGGENRTLYNATFSDATLHFKHGNEMVTHWALNQKGQGYSYQRPYFEVEVRDYNKMISDYVIERFLKWLDFEEPMVLNIAGNADQRMEPVVYDFMIRALTDRAPAAIVSAGSSTTSPSQ